MFFLSPMKSDFVLFENRSNTLYNSLRAYNKDYLSHVLNTETDTKMVALLNQLISMMEPFEQAGLSPIVVVTAARQYVVTSYEMIDNKFNN